ncbi:MAG: hypothetical protein HFG59_02075 [Lachnospiraceae bacterium]|nr:hypothetical protein [Lachnospiraceae bacterium]
MEGWMIRLLNMSFAAGCTVVIVMVLRLLLRRLPKGYCYGLWLVVLFRFLCPVVITSPYSLFPLDPEPVAREIVYEIRPGVETGVSWIDQTVNRGLGEWLGAEDLSRSVNPVQIWLAVALLVWIVGVFLFAGYHIWQWAALRRRVAGAVPVKWGEEPGLVWESEGVDGAFVLGVLHPLVYLPAGLKEESRGYILCHERMHIRRRDYLVRLLGLMAVGIHWFNPLAWAGFWMMCMDMEMSCDEAVLKGMDEAGRKGYMRTLLEQAERQSGLLGPAFGKSPVYRRIRNILGYRKPGKVLGILAAGGLAVAGIGLVTSPESAAKSVAIIGGADGPTSIFLAGKTGSGTEDGLEKLEEFYGKLDRNIYYADGYLYYEGEREDGGFPVPLMRMAPDFENEEMVGELPGSLVCVRDGGACLWMDWERKRIMAGAVDRLGEPGYGPYTYLANGEQGRRESCTMEKTGTGWLRIVLTDLEEPSRQEEYLLQIPEGMQDEEF